MPRNSSRAQLKPAACPRTPPAATLTFAGYHALWSLNRALEQLQSVQPTAFGRDLAASCPALGASGDFQALMIQETCQASAQLIDDYTGAADCRRSRLSVCEGAYLSDAAGDLERIALASAEVAREVTGTCQAGATLGARLDNQLAQSVNSYEVGVVTRDLRQEHAAEVRDRLITQEMERERVRSAAFLAACAPSPANALSIWLRLRNPGGGMGGMARREPDGRIQLRVKMLGLGPNHRGAGIKSRCAALRGMIRSDCL